MDQKKKKKKKAKVKVKWNKMATETDYQAEVLVQESGWIPWSFFEAIWTNESLFNFLYEFFFH